MCCRSALERCRRLTVKLGSWRQVVCTRKGGGAHYCARGRVHRRSRPSICAQNRYGKADGRCGRLACWRSRGQRGEGTRERLAKRARSESSRISQDKIFFVSKKILDFLCFPMPPLPSKVYSTSNLEMSNAKRVIVSAPVSGPLRGGSSPLAPSCSLSCSPQELAGLAGLSVVPEGLAATVVIR